MAYLQEGKGGGKIVIHQGSGTSATGKDWRRHSGDAGRRLAPLQTSIFDQDEPNIVVLQVCSCLIVSIGTFIGGI